MKKLWVYLLALAAVALCLLPAPAHAISPGGNHGAHCICGLETHSDIGDIGDHRDERMIGDNDWEELDAVGLNSGTAELSGGCYYLTGNKKLEKTLVITGDVTICLNGYNLNCEGNPGIRIEEGAALTITTCKNGGKVFQQAAGRHIVNRGTLNLFDGMLHGDDSQGGVNNLGTFRMYGGQIMCCRDSADDPGYGGVCSVGTMYMYGGTIRNNQATNGTACGGVWNRGTMHLAGCVKITGNTGGDGKDDLCTEKPIRLDGALKNSLNAPAEIGLWWLNDFAVETTVVQAGTATGTDTLYQLRDSDINCFAMVNSNNYDGLSLMLYPNANAGKLTDHRNHALCTGDHSSSAPGHSDKCGGDVTFQPWESTTSLPTQRGSYYLTADVTLPDLLSTQINSNITLCLNGHTITANGNFAAIKVNGGGDLTVTDCKNNTGRITHADGEKDCGVEVVGKFYMYGGTITGNIGDNNTAQCNVYVSGGKFHMYGGRISSGVNDVVGVCVYGGTFEMNCAVGDEPAISNDAGGFAVVVNAPSRNGGTFHLKNGYIKGNANQGEYAVTVGGGTTITLGGTVRIDGGLELPYDSGGQNGKLSASNSFRLADSSKKIQLTLGTAVGDVSGYFNAADEWWQSKLNNFAGEGGKVFIQTNTQSNADIRLLMAVDVPAGTAGLTYNGTEQTGVEAGTGYTVIKNSIMGDSTIDAGNYMANVRIKDGYAWKTIGGYKFSDQYIDWIIARKDPEAGDFTVTGLGERAYDGDPKSVTVALAAKYPAQQIKLAVYYTKDGVTTTDAPADAGAYTVTLEVIASRNFNTTAVPLELGTLTIREASQTAPTGLTGVAPSTTNGTDGKITGVDDTMEYQVENDTVWRRCTGTEINGLSAGTHQVRYAAIGSNIAASDAASVVVPVHAHVWLGTWSDYDAAHHAHPCANGDAWDTDTMELHVYADRNDDTCDVCGHVRSVTRIWTVRFLPGGGSGSMASLEQHEGTAYILPACGFTAPEGKTFDKWLGVDGVTYNVGDTYTITGDTELTALWKNKAVTPDPDPVDPDPDKPARPVRPTGGTSPKTFDAGVTGYAAAALLSLNGVWCLRRRRDDRV